MSYQPNHGTATAITDPFLINLVELTSQREQNLLERSLLTTLIECLGANHAELFACRWINGAPYVRRQTVVSRDTDGNAQVNILDSETWAPPVVPMYNALQSGNTVQLNPSGHTLMLRCLGSVVAIVRFRCDDQQLNVGALTAMARINENFLRLLFEADRDMLTGLHNRRKFDAHLYTLISGLILEKRDDAKAVLAIIDADNFKRINDGFGHQIGDEILLLLAQQLQHCFDEDDGLYRYGGEEFAVILRNVTPDQAAQALERFRVSIEQFPFPQIGQLTISAGFTEIHRGQLPTTLIGQADKALLYSKKQGKNRVNHYHTLTADGLLEENTVQGDVTLF